MRTQKAGQLYNQFLLRLLLLGLLFVLLWAVLPAQAGSRPDIKVSLDRTSVRVGETLTANWSVTGGTPPFEYVTSWSIWSEGYYRSPEVLTKQTSASYTPLFGFSVEMNLEVREISTGNRYEAWSDCIDILGTSISEPLNCTSPTFDRSSVRVGDTITASWDVSGGTPPYQCLYAWDFGGAYSSEVDQNWLKADGTSCSIVVPRAGKALLNVLILDAKGRCARGERFFEVAGEGTSEKLKVKIQLSTTSVPVNQPITANVSITGGVPPYQSKLHWRYSMHDALFFLDSRSVDKSGSAVIDTQAFPRGTNGDVKVQVTDSKGNSFYGYEWFEITGSDYERFLVTDVKLAKGRLKAGESQAVTVTLSDSGGTPPFEYRLAWNYGRALSTNNYGKCICILDHFTGVERSHTFTRVVPRWALGESYIGVSVTDAVGLAVGTSEGGVIVPDYFVLMNDSPQEPISGDANGDNAVDILDLVAIIDYIVSGTPSASMDNADANGDGAVDILDLVWIIDKIVGG